jgi:hypothetical protein
MIEEIKKITHKMCLITGINTAHDYDGIETDNDILLYLTEIMNHYLKVPTKLEREKLKYLGKQIEDLSKKEMLECIRFLYNKNKKHENNQINLLEEILKNVQNITKNF